MKHVNPDNLSRIELLDHCADLQARLDAMAASIDMATAHLQRLLGLTPLEAQILQLMGDGTVRTKEQIMTALYWDRIADGEVPGTKIIDVWVCRTRKKLSGTGIVIQTMWGRGYYLEGTDKLKKVMAGEEPERDGPVFVPLSGRAPGSAVRPKGSVLAKVLEVLRLRADDNDRIRVTSRELAAEAGIGNPGTYVRLMEGAGKLRVLQAAKPGAGEKTWVLELQ